MLIRSLRAGPASVGPFLWLRYTQLEHSRPGVEKGRQRMDLEAGGSSAPLIYTPEIARTTAPVYERVRQVIPAMEWPVFAPYVDAINRLKVQRNAVILA